MIILKYINGFHSAFIIIIIVVIFYVLNCYQHNDIYIYIFLYYYIFIFISL